MRKCDVGGQAIIEGVMMRGSKGVATAVRTPNGEIEVKVEKTKPITKKYKFLIDIDKELCYTKKKERISVYEKNIVGQSWRGRKRVWADGKDVHR